MTEIVTVAGLEPRQLDWVARLYGRADPKYRHRTFLEHLFLENPVGPSLHAFAVDADRPVGHICIVRTAARYGAEQLAAGKLEGLWIDESHRGRRPGDEPVVAELLTRLYAFSDAQGIDLVHALATPHIGDIIRFTPLSGVGEQSLVSLVKARTLATRALAVAQRAAGAIAGLPPAHAVLRRATAQDVDLAQVPLPPSGRWAIVPDGAWEWYASSPFVRVLELDRSRSLVQLPAAPHEPLRLAGWHAEQATMRAALRLLAAAGRVAREHGAATLRFQPWSSPAGNGTLARACRLVGFVPRDDLTTVWVHASNRELVRREAVVPTPFLYLGF